VDWAMVGAIGEILGAAGVIATLGYLAVQIRGSAREARRAAMQEVIDQSADLLERIGTSAETTVAWMKGLAADDGLTPVQQAQFRILIYRVALLWERTFYMHEAGELDAWIMEESRRVRRGLVSSPGFKAWYDEAPSAHWLSDGFRKALEQDMALGGTYTPSVRLPGGQIGSKAS
jgi:hypothetical protein